MFAPILKTCYKLYYVYLAVAVLPTGLRATVYHSHPNLQYFAPPPPVLKQET